MIAFFCMANQHSNTIFIITRQPLQKRCNKKGKTSGFLIFSFYFMYSFQTSTQNIPPNCNRSCNRAGSC